MTHLNGYDIYDYFTAGANKLIHNEAALNAINVFPVADGDTGSNLAYTMKCILANTQRHESVESVLEDISRAALEDAYGNSGTIFASFLYGFFIGAKSKDQLSLEDFAITSKEAETYAYKSLMSPVEGTILTVISAWSNFLNTHYPSYTSFKHFLTDATKHASDALKMTKEQLRVLSDYDVVDAGGYGFVLFLEGMLEVFTSEFKSLIEPKLFKKTIDQHEEPTKRYCSEFTLEIQDDKNLNHLKQVLNDLGDSLIIQHHSNHVKLHLHTDVPTLVVSEISSHGHIIKSKIDDMYLQVALKNRGKRPIGILTDSIADVPKKCFEDDLVYVIPLQVLINGNAYTDRLGIDNQRLFKLMNEVKKAPTSSHPSDIAVEKAVHFMLDHFEKVICIFVSSELSGLYNQAKIIQNCFSQETLALIDSRTNSAAQGLMVLRAHDMIISGKSFSEIVHTLRRERDAYQIYVEIPDLQYASLSGRVPKAVGTIAHLLKIKAVISIDELGNGIVTKDRSLDKVIKKLSDRSISRYSIVYTGDLQSHRDRISQIVEAIGEEPEDILETSNVVSALVGKGALGIGIYED